VAWGTLAVVTVHAVVVTSSAVIGRDVTAKVAFVLDIGLFVLVAIRDTKLIVFFIVEKLALRALLIKSSTKANHCTCSLVLLFLQPSYIFIVTASLEATEVCTFACPTLIVVEVIDRKLFKVVEVFAFRVCQSLVQI
jgi:hypothetical protein